MTQDMHGAKIQQCIRCGKSGRNGPVKRRRVELLLAEHRKKRVAEQHVTARQDDKAPTGPPRRNILGVELEKAAPAPRDDAAMQRLVDRDHADPRRRGVGRNLEEVLELGGVDFPAANPLHRRPLADEKLALDQRCLAPKDDVVDQPLQPPDIIASEIVMPRRDGKADVHFLVGVVLGFSPLGPLLGSVCWRGRWHSFAACLGPEEFEPVVERDGGLV